MFVLLFVIFPHVSTNHVLKVWFLLEFFFFLFYRLFMCTKFKKCPVFGRHTNFGCAYAYLFLLVGSVSLHFPIQLFFVCVCSFNLHFAFFYIHFNLNIHSVLSSKRVILKVHDLMEKGENG